MEKTAHSGLGKLRDRYGHGQTGMARALTLVPAELGGTSFLSSYARFRAAGTDTRGISSQLEGRIRNKLAGKTLWAQLPRSENVDAQRPRRIRISVHRRAWAFPAC